MDIEWTRADFERLGFVGWKPFGDLARGDLPAALGVYVVTTPPLRAPEFRPRSVGGPHKGRVVGWRATPGLDPGEVENALLALHIEQFNVRPFANLTGGGKVRPGEVRELLSRLLVD